MSDVAEKAWPVFEEEALKELKKCALMEGLSHLVTEEVIREILRRVRIDFLHNWKPGRKWLGDFYRERVATEFQLKLRELLRES